MCVLSETRLTCEEAAARMKKSRRTIERWMRAGFDGHVLDSATVGMCRFTSAEALDRFVAATSRKAVVA